LIAGGPCTPAGALHCARAPFRALIDRRGPQHPPAALHYARAPFRALIDRRGLLLGPPKPWRRGPPRLARSIPRAHRSPETPAWPAEASGKAATPPGDPSLYDSDHQPRSNLSTAPSAFGRAG